MRNDWAKIESETIDWLRPVMAFMVICLHVQFFYVDEQWSMNGGLFDVFVIVLCKVICPVAVPTFYFISGYLFYKGLQEWNADAWKGKMTKRIRSLLVPFLLWNIIALIAFPLTRYAGSVIKGVPMDNFLDIIRERGFLRLFWDRTLFDGSIGQPMNTPLWFLRDLMVVMLFTPIIHWLVKRTGALSVLVLGTLYLVNLWIPVPGFGITAAFFFTWGSLYSIRGQGFIERFRKIRIPVLILFVAGLIITPMLWDKDYQAFNRALRFFIIITTVFCFNTISSLIAEEKTHVNRNLADSSFFIYCSHMVIIASAVMWLVMLPPFRSGIISSLLFIIGAILIYIICHFIYVFLERFCPSIAGALTGGRIKNK